MDTAPEPDTPSPPASDTQEEVRDLRSALAVERAVAAERNRIIEVLVDVTMALIEGLPHAEPPPPDHGQTMADPAPHPRT